MENYTNEELQKQIIDPLWRDGYHAAAKLIEYLVADNKKLMEQLILRNDELLRLRDEAKQKRNTAEGLPEFCFSCNPCSETLIRIVKGENGYHEGGGTVKPGKEAREKADSLNSVLGVTKAQEMAMVAGSMFGWDSPLADPANRIEYGSMLSQHQQAESTLDASKKPSSITVLTCFHHTEYGDDVYVYLKDSPKDAEDFIEQAKQECGYGEYSDPEDDESETFGTNITEHLRDADGNWVPKTVGHSHFV